MPKKMSQIEFIEISKIIHKDKYDYSFTEYEGSKDNVNILCPIHGVFSQRAFNHLSGRGCSKCAYEIASINYRSNNEEFIKKSNIIHNRFYDYEFVQYINNRKKVKIICPEHGFFQQSPNSHLSGKGCPKCRGLNKTTSDVISSFEKIHSDRYDYSEVNYNRMDIKVKILCHQHGQFYQTPHSHLKGRGCPDCNLSKGEAAIESFLKENNFEFIKQFKFEKCKSVRILSFDFYLPKHNICIEYNGLQHYEENEYFGGKEFLDGQIRRDEIKKEYCEKNGIGLLVIKYSDDLLERLKVINSLPLNIL